MATAEQTPVHAKIPFICRRHGDSRSNVYKHLANGDYDAIKVGRSTLIDVASADRYYGSLPKAQFKPAKASVRTEPAKIKPPPDRKPPSANPDAKALAARKGKRARARKAPEDGASPPPANTSKQPEAE
jgi:hypothetical protein